jgi:hypothetical protein
MNRKVCLIGLINLVFIQSSYAENCGDNCGDLPGPPVNPLLFPVDVNPASFVEPTQMSENTGQTFVLKELIGTSINGMLDSSCGGWCITGVCAHWKWGFSLTKGAYMYTIVSPRIKHALPELLISAYDDVGEEPLKEWRDSFGKVISTSNTTVGSMLGLFDGLQGGRSDPLEQGQHQTISFKEVDIVGHPMSILPDLINEGAAPSLSGYRVPEYLDDSPVKSAVIDTGTTDKLEKTGFGFDPDKIRIPTMDEVVNTIKQKLVAAIQAFQIIQQIEAVLQAVQTIKKIKENVNTILDGFEATSMAAIASSGWGVLAKPRFRAPKLFCPTNIKPFQPYYLSFADAFWWRSGYPITDGPLSGTDHSKTIINPFSTDTLQKVNKVTDVFTKEIWGNLYPRDGTLNQSHDAKTGSVLAWRAMDVLKTVVKPGYRVGVDLPHSIEGGKWQMIFPEVKSCRVDPYYPQGKDLKVDSLKPSGYGGYAWNYYMTYECCSNTSGNKIGELTLPTVCLELGNILAGIDADRTAYEQYLQNQQNPDQIGGN